MKVGGALIGTFLIAVVILVAWILVYFDSQKTIAISNSQIGCYRGSGRFFDVTVIITKESNLESANIKLPVSVVQDKEGLSFETLKKVILIESTHTLEISTGKPDLFRINSDKSFYVLTDQENLVLFFPCSPHQHQLAAINTNNFGNTY
jgi:hypothetical protein